MDRVYKSGIKISVMKSKYKQGINPVREGQAEPKPDIENNSPESRKALPKKKDQRLGSDNNEHDNHKGEPVPRH